jgi:hypothetical protein
VAFRGAANDRVDLLHDPSSDYSLAAGIDDRKIAQSKPPPKRPIGYALPIKTAVCTQNVQVRKYLRRILDILKIK